MKKVYVCEFYQESNSFHPILSEKNLFICSDCVWQADRDPQYVGDEGLAIEGIRSALEAAGIEPVFGPGYSAPSGGPVEQAFFEDFLSRMSRSLQAAMPVDGVILSLHGGTVSEQSDDVCGDILARVRKIVGDLVPISAAFDMHANITKKMLENMDVFTGYQTYPHLDMYDTGFRAAKLLIDLSERSLFTACVRLPMIAPANGYTTTKGSLKTWVEEISAVPAADWSLFMAQPWLDVPETGAAVILIGEEKDLIQRHAEILGEKLFALRAQLQGEPLLSIDAVIEAALRNQTDKPIVLADSADSPNAGATGDCATVLAHMLPYRSTMRCAVAVNDPEAVKQAFMLGVGGKGTFTLGAAIAPKLSEPVTVTDAVVRSLHSGTFLMGGPAERGSRQELGPCAVLDAGDIQILVTTSATRNGDLQFFRAFGIEPTLCRLVSVKACTSFRAGYEPIAAAIINTSTPGASASDLKQLPYKKLPKGLYPFE